MPTPFTDYTAPVPNLEETQERYAALMASLDSATTSDDALTALRAWDKLLTGDQGMGVADPDPVPPRYGECRIQSSDGLPRCRRIEIHDT